MTTDLLSVARGLRPLVEKEAEATDREGTLSARLVEAFAESGLNHLQVPRELGGLEADVDTVLDVLEELASQDGSVGWTFMANANSTAMCAMLDPTIAKEMLSGGSGIVCAGQLASRGKAHRSDGGYQVRGRFQFGSGIAHASWVGGGALILDADGNRELDDAGIPKVLAFFVPKDTVTLTGNWDVLGLRGTGSFDYTIAEQFIEDGRSFWLFDAQARSGGGVYRLGARGFAGIGHAGWALGAARGALDEVRRMLQGGRARIGGGPMREEQVIQRAFAEHTLALQSVRLLAHDTFGQAVADLEAGGSLTPETLDRIVASVTHVTNVCVAAVQWAYGISGSQGLRNPSRVQRCFRDMHVGSQHIYVDPGSLDAMGKSLLAPCPDPAVD